MKRKKKQQKKKSYILKILTQLNEFLREPKISFLFDVWSQD